MFRRAGFRFHARAASFALVAASGAALLGAPRTDALPLFARRTGLACAGCHASGARLNARGMAYLRSGFRSVSPAAESRPSEVPLSVTGEMSVARRSVAANVPAARRSPRRAADVEIESAGILGRHASFELRDSLATTLDDSKLATAWLRLDALAGGRLDLRMGRFAAELPWLSVARRGTEAPWLAPVGSTVSGFELGGTLSDWSWGAGLVESERTQPHSLARRQGLLGLEDKLFWVTRDGAAASAGIRVRFGHQASNLPQHAWLQRVQAEASGVANLARTRLVTAYNFDRFDDRPMAGIHERHQYGLLEAVEPLDGDRRWTLTARLEHEHRTRTVITSEADRHLEVLALGDQLRPNLGLALEWSHSGDNVGGPRREGIDAVCRVSY